LSIPMLKANGKEFIVRLEFLKFFLQFFEFFREKNIEIFVKILDIITKYILYYVY
jgi:hypothetical protein